MEPEVGDVFFFCLGFDQRAEADARMAEMAKQKQSQLSEELSR